MDWIRRFMSAMRQAESKMKISIEMVYVGKSNPKERVRKINTVIKEENLSHYWPELNMIWFFWVRLESMLYSKMQLGRTVENDAIMQEVMTMLTFNDSDKGWALISKGSTDMVRAHGDQITDCLMQIDEWMENVGPEEFIQALRDAVLSFHTLEHCTRLILPGTTGRITENVVCSECKRPMEKFILYRCCTD